MVKHRSLQSHQAFISSNRPVTSSHHQHQLKVYNIYLIFAASYRSNLYAVYTSSE